MVKFVSKVGAPYKYKPEYCDLALELFKKGHSKSGVIGKIGVDRNTIDNWIANFPEFAAVMEMGRDISTNAWEKNAIDIASGKNKKGNATIIAFGLRNINPKEWGAGSLRNIVSSEEDTGSTTTIIVKKDETTN